ncbi:uncharacterized protein RAG0_12889 [Rhynchosporium agropyri]|uniref:Uncharacterized protein n=1 Tax=Rhynchosporium agropyri TaxID=914238 RepID=A0A1E1LAC7_9HELO|nr:uncharacterized protein RAG0_12889 [Rhynchosporium agropyri]
MAWDEYKETEEEYPIKRVLKDRKCKSGNVGHPQLLSITSRNFAITPLASGSSNEAYY